MKGLACMIPIEHELGIMTLKKYRTGFIARYIILYNIAQGRTGYLVKDPRHMQQIAGFCKHLREGGPTYQGMSSGNFCYYFWVKDA